LDALEWDQLLEERIHLSAGKINVPWFKDKEERLVALGMPRSHRLIVAMSQRPDLYHSELRWEMQEAERRGKFVLRRTQQAFRRQVCC
jgi:hypothetical protein